jgi:Domain of unknown function (DUF4129)
MRSLTLLFLFIITCFSAFAQDEPVLEADSTYVSAETTVEQPSYSEEEDSDGDLENSEIITVNPQDISSLERYKNQSIEKKKFDQKKWKEIVGDETFEEKPEKIKPEDEPKMTESSRSHSSPFGAINPGLFQGLSYLFIFILVILILWLVLKNTRFKESIKKQKLTAVDATAPVENIEELEADDLLKDALANGDLRLAVRIHYLRLLKKLNEVGLILWKKDKTNRDYLNELYGKENYYEGVRKLTLAYEIVWYGERSVSADAFQRLSGEFDIVNREVLQFKPTAE